MASYKSSSVWVPFERRALANSAIMSAGALGLVVATEPTAYVVMLIGWRNVFLAFAAIISLVAGFIFLAVPEKPQSATPPSVLRQTREMAAILRTPLFWRVAPMLGLSAGIGMAYQSLWAGPWFLDVMQLSRPDAARHLLWMGVAFLLGILFAGVVADRLQNMGVSIMKIYLAFMVPHTFAQLLLVLNIGGASFFAWLLLSAASQSAVLAFPWFAARIGEGMAGRANATINFSMFVVAFATQYGVGLVLSFWPRTAAGGYAPEGYSAAFAIFLSLQVIAIIWYLLGAKGEAAP
jgi:predicted MFS family arabinose efflux permease